MLVDAFCLLLMTDELFNKLHINHQPQSASSWLSSVAVGRKISYL